LVIGLAVMVTVTSLPADAVETSVGDAVTVYIELGMLDADSDVKIAVVTLDSVAVEGMAARTPSRAAAARALLM